MKAETQRIALCAALLLGSVEWLGAEEFSEHFIAAKAGMVNYIEGEPRVILAPSEKAIQIPAVRGQVANGGQIRTGENDRVEILLNPGGYLRVGSHTDLRVLDTDFGAMHFAVARGSVIVESVTFNKKVHSLTLSTPSGDIRLLKDGLYRVDVVPAQNVELQIRKGKLSWQRDGAEAAQLTSGNRYNLGAPLANGKVQYVKLDKAYKDADAFDRWSGRRAEFLVAANSRLSSYQLGWVSRTYPYSWRGGWFFNPLFNCYTFVPFDGSFGSPYGFTYGLFLPVRTFYGRGYNEPSWSGAAGGYSGPRMTTNDQRGSVSSAPSAPAARVETGRSEQESRSSTLGRMQNR